MAIRPFSWTDLVTLYRYRGAVLCLDNSLSLTRGSPVGVSALLGQLHPARGTFTGVNQEDSQPVLLGQVTYLMGNRSARISFLAPECDQSNQSVAGLLDGLAWQAGEMGAFNLLAEVDEQSPAFECLRRAGFSVYAWQRVYRLSFPVEAGQTSGWQNAASTDEQAVRNLYQMLVPPLVQSAEPISGRRIAGLVFRHKGEVMAYADCIFGPRGIYVIPLFHPDIADGLALLRGLMPALAPLLRRPVFLAVRSYQAWLENLLADLPAEASPRQALLVKHLTSAARVPLNARLSAIEPRQAEQGTAPMVNRIEGK